MKLSTLINAPLYFVAAALGPPACAWFGACAFAGPKLGLKDDVLAGGGMDNGVGMLLCFLGLVGVGMMLVSGVVAILMQLLGIPLPLGYLGTYLLLCGAITLYILRAE